MGRINSSGWSIFVTHPDTGRTLTADVLDDPQLSPSLGPSSPFAELRAPVRKSPAWLDVPTPADMEVYLDGERQPIEELRDVDDRNDRTILVGRGGVEFENRVQAEYRSQRRHVAADELLTNETPYTADVDTPTQSVETDVFQDPSTTAEFTAESDATATSPADFSGDQAALYDTCVPFDGTAYDTSGGTDSFVSAEFSGSSPDDCFGRAVALTDADVGATVEWSFTIDYDWDASNWDLGIRWAGNITSPGFIDVEWKVDGGQPVQFAAGTGGSENLSWIENLYASEGGGTEPPTLSAGTHTITAEVTAAPGAGTFWIDFLAPHDTRLSYTFDDTVTCVNGVNLLDGPGNVGDLWDVRFEDEQSPFSIVAADATVTPATGTTAPQRVQVTPDRGTSWLPDDGTEANTNSIDVDFADPTATVGLRVGLGGHSPQGTRDQTPRENYASEAIESYELRADVSFESLLIDEDFDNDLASVLNSVAGDEEFVYSFRYENGTPTVVWTQPGQRTADSTPELAADPRVEKAGTPYDRVVVKGSNERVANEPFTAQTTFQSLVNSRLTTGSETVYDDTQNYERGVDYEMNYSSGEIRALSGGSLTAGTTYRIDYSRTAQGSFAVDPLPADPRERVLDVAGVVSDRQAEQIAFVLLNEFDDARYRAQVTLPRPDVRFDPVEAQPLGGLSLPAGVTPLEPRGTPEITPRGLSVTLGREQGLDSAARQIGEQLRQVTRRT